MKIIKYKFLVCEINHGMEEEPNIGRIFLDKIIPWSESNEEIAKREAYNGEYTIDDDGKESAPTTEERLNALEGAMLEMMRVSEQ